MIYNSILKCLPETRHFKFRRPRYFLSTELWAKYTWHMQTTYRYLLIQKLFIITMAQLIWTSLHIIRQYEKEMFFQTKNWPWLAYTLLLCYVYIIRCDCDVFVCTRAGSIVLCKYWERYIHECIPAFDWPDDMLQADMVIYKQVQNLPLIGEYSNVIIRHVTWAYEDFRSFTEPL